MSADLLRADETNPPGMAVTEEGNVEQTDEKISDSKFKHASKWGVVGILAFAVLIVAWKWGPPNITTDAPDRWTGTDQLRFEAANNARLDKQDRILESLSNLIAVQVKQGDRLLSLYERQDDRLKALEEWRIGEMRK